MINKDALFFLLSARLIFVCKLLRNLIGLGYAAEI